MDGASFTTITEVMKVSSPWGILGLLFWGYWTLSARKDKEIRNLNRLMLEITEKNTIALMKVEAALTSLRSAIEALGKK